jgi:NADH-quinone oxidoreductase subunit M
MMWLAIGVLAGFAVKVPMFPFHTWLPAAYAEAPSPVTMLLTGAMSKMGVYGLLRIALPLFGHQIAQMRTPLLVLAVATVVMGAWAAAAQKDLKRCSRILRESPGLLPAGHFCAGGAGSIGPGQLASQAAALNGVILQMFNHGVTAAALFWFVAMMQQRTGGHRGIDDFGGLRKPAPVLAGLMGIALFSSLGLPGLNGFVGEFLIFRGVFSLAWVAATVSILGLLVTAAVILTVIQKVFTGPVPEHWRGFPDLHTASGLALAPVIGLMLLIGLLPQLIVDSVNPTVKTCWRTGDFRCWRGRSISRLPERCCWRCCPRERCLARWLALAVAVAGLAAGVGFVAGMGQGRVVIVDAAWVPSMGIHYLLAADGISRVLVLLTGLAAVAGRAVQLEHRAAHQ